VRALARLPRTHVFVVSSLYLTAPREKETQPDFLNAAVGLESACTPLGLLDLMQRIEADLGRVRSERFGPRTIDIDLVWYDGPEVAHPRLALPHPRVRARRFVLEPLAEIAPGLEFVPGLTVEQALARVAHQRVERMTCEANTKGWWLSMQHSTEVQAVAERASLSRRLRRLAEEKGAVILAHNYQRPEIQDAADFVGDSLGLARKAAASEARLILFCGVDFMAETAAILAPDRTVVMPEAKACCPMAQMVDPDDLRAFKAEHPGALVVSYVNTSAAVKAESDVCCTSANAVQVVESLPADQDIIFTPDRNLGAWVMKRTGRPMVLWEGFCPTHDLIELEDALAARREHPGAKLVVHPECRTEVSDTADAVESTSGMVRFCREDKGKEFIIGTELGMIYRLEQDVPGKRFYPVTNMAVCPNMKLTTLENAVTALEREEPVITVPEPIRLAALRAVERMVAIGR